MSFPDERSEDASSLAAAVSARGPYLTAVKEAWRQALSSADGRDPRLDLALRSFARDGRARGVPVATLLRALDAVVKPAVGGEAELDVPTIREWAGTTVIRAYFTAD